MIFIKALDVTPEITAIVDNVDSFDRLPCPNCNDQMWLVDNGDYPIERYKGNGMFVRTDRFCCDKCDTYADITSVYERRGTRKVKVMQDVYEETR